MTEKNSLRHRLLILFGALVIIVLVVLIALDQRQKIGAGRSQKVKAPVIASQNLSVNSANGEVAPSKSVTPTATATANVLQVATKVATGTSLITPNNIVVNKQGVPVKLNVMPSSQDAPTESAPINPSQVSNNANTIRMSVSAAGFVPKTFTVKAGQLVNFVLTSTDNYTHIWQLKDPSLEATILGVAGHETRVKSWNAPKKGVYPFICAVPGHAARGETGTMIVK